MKRLLVSMALHAAQIALQSYRAFALVTSR